MLHDVAIVGAGPAGAWAAHRLAAGGARVVLFDHSHPREKPCGGGITSRALAIVGDVLRRHACDAVTVRRARFQADDAHHQAVLDLPVDGCSADSALVVASRRDFDGALVRAAVASGATLVAERVVDVRQDRSAVAVTTPRREHRASIVLGGDGANSLTRRRLIRPFSRAQLSIATGYFARGASSDEIVVRSVSSPAGYFWSFPRRDHLAVGVCAAADAGRTAEELRADTAGWIETASLAPRAALVPYSWPIPSLGSDALDEPLSGNRWLLLGDAAGLVDPLTREGIYFAVRSADLAADAILAGLGDPASAYERSVRDEIHPELKRAARLVRGFFHRGFTALLVDALGASPRIRSVMADLIAGRQTYRGLEWRLAGTGEMGLARRLLMLKLGVD